MPFNTNSGRFLKSKEAELPPGPGTYIDIYNPVNSSVLKETENILNEREYAEKRGAVFGPFGSHAQRFKGGSSLANLNEVPGPGQYESKTTFANEKSVEEPYIDPRANH